MDINTSFHKDTKIAKVRAKLDRIGADGITVRTVNRKDGRQALKMEGVPALDFNYYYEFFRTNQISVE